MMERPEDAVVFVRLADCAQDFVEAALDLLVAVEDSGVQDESPISSFDAYVIREKAEALRKIADAGDW